MKTSKERAEELGLTIINDHGTECVLYADLLNAAHTHGAYNKSKFLGFKPPEIIKFSSQNQECIVLATAVFENDFEVSAIGHTSQENMSSLKDHFVTSAETRAKSRALRDALNFCLVSYEELAINTSRPPSSIIKLRHNEDIVSKPITQPQIKAINSYLSKLDNGESILSYILAQIHITSLSDATSTEGDKIIKDLSRRKQKSMQEQR